LLRICNNETEANYMNAAQIKIVSRYDFEHMDLDGCPFAISIREADETELPRPSYTGKRLNLSFYDLTEGPGIATADDIRMVHSFAEEWGWQRCTLMGQPAWSFIALSESREAQQSLWFRFCGTTRTNLPWPGGSSKSTDGEIRTRSMLST